MSADIFESAIDFIDGDANPDADDDDFLERREAESQEPSDGSQSLLPDSELSEGFALHENVVPTLVGCGIVIAAICLAMANGYWVVKNPIPLRNLIGPALVAMLFSIPLSFLISSLFAVVSWHLHRVSGGELFARRQLRTATRVMRKEIESTSRIIAETARLQSRLDSAFALEREIRTLTNAETAHAMQVVLEEQAIKNGNLRIGKMENVIEQYSEMLSDIESADLPLKRKRALIERLRTGIDKAARSELQTVTADMLEITMWKARLQYAKLLAKDSRESAIAYLEQELPKADNSRVRRRVKGILKQLQAS